MSAPLILVWPALVAASTLLPGLPGDVSDRSKRDQGRDQPWLFAEIASGWFSSEPSGQAIDAGGETFDYDEIWVAGFGFWAQLRLHFGILAGEKTGLTIGPGLFIGSQGYGTEGGTRTLHLSDGTVLRPESLSIARLLATFHARYLLPLGFFAGAQIGVGLAFTSEPSIGFTDSAGVPKETTLYRKTETYASDIRLRAGWRGAVTGAGAGFYFEVGLGIIGAPRRGGYPGADPDPILHWFFGMGFVFEIGWVTPRNVTAQSSSASHAQ